MDKETEGFQVQDYFDKMLVPKALKAAKNLLDSPDEKIVAAQVKEILDKVLAKKGDSNTGDKTLILNVPREYLEKTLGKVGRILGNAKTMDEERMD